jgi:hypothetical protein
MYGKVQRHQTTAVYKKQWLAAMRMMEDINTTNESRI